MNSTALLFFDQVRSNLCILLAYFLFCSQMIVPRQRLKARLAACVAVNILMALAWLPVYAHLQDAFDKYLWMGYAYYVVNLLLLMGYVLFCYEISLAQASFCCLAGNAMNVIPNTILRALFVDIWFPLLPEQHFLLYVLLWLAIYGICYGGIYYLLIRKIDREVGIAFERIRNTGVIGFFLFIAFNLSTAVIQMIAEYVLENVYRKIDTTEISSNLLQINYFLIAVMIVYAVLVLDMIYFIYGRLIAQQENTVIGQLMNERRLQYTFTKENMDLINRKSHDLRHQLSAIEVASESERQEIIREAKKAVDLYDSAFSTGNDVLDTILTEKNILCRNRDIRLSCIANAGNLDRIRVVDLYTLLGNALDNSIESVSELSDSEKRSISVRVENRGKMIHILVENYYQGSIKMQGGQPVTSKKDKQNHGFGIRSMQTIAKRYGGDIHIFTENQIFTLQILLMPQETDG